MNNLKRKFIKYFALLAVFFLAFTALAQQVKEITMNNILAKIKITTPNQELIVSLFDTPASKQLLAQLPLNLDFSDFGGSEKIAYPPKKLTTQNSPNAEQLKGDFTYYAPWGNIAIFYKGMGYGTQLFTLGQITSGKEDLNTIKQNFSATIERIE